MLFRSLLLVVTILNNSIDPRFKNIVVFWRLNNPLPGCRAFSVYLDELERVSPKKVIEEHGPFPDDPIEQNEVWYRLYQKVKNEPEIYTAQLKYLLARDMATLCLIFLVLFPFYCFVVGTGWRVALNILGMELLVYLGFMVAARTSSVSFVSL